MRLLFVRLLKSMSVVAASLILVSAGTAGAQLFDQFGNPNRLCGEGIDEGIPCNDDNLTCDLEEDDDELGLCDVLVIAGFMGTLDNPDVYVLNNEFIDNENVTTMYAWFDLDGLNFAAGRARRTEDLGGGNEVRADFNWVIGVPTKVRQKEKRNVVNQDSYLAILLNFSAVIRGGQGEQDSFTTLFEIADEGDPTLPTEIETCSAKVTVREPTKAKNAEDLRRIFLDATWRIDCDDLPMPDGLACVDGEETCSPELQATSRELLDFFEGRKDKIKARGKSEENYCESWITGPELPSACE